MSSDPTPVADPTTEQMRREAGHDCIACPSAVRDLYATAYNLLVRITAGAPLERKAEELRDSIARMQPILDGHFAALEEWRSQTKAPAIPAPNGVTTDRNDPRLTHGADPEGAQVPQAEVYLVLSEAERAKGFVRPVRRSYVHLVCGVVTVMSQALAETYACQPKFYGATYCAGCQAHRPVGENGEFVWDGTDIKVGT